MAPPQQRHDRAESVKAVHAHRATKKWPHSLQQANPQPAHTQRRHLHQKIPTPAQTRDQQLEIQQTPLMRGRFGFTQPQPWTPTPIYIARRQIEYLLSSVRDAEMTGGA